MEYIKTHSLLSLKDGEYIKVDVLGAQFFTLYYTPKLERESEVFSFENIKENEEVNNIIKLLWREIRAVYNFPENTSLMFSNKGVCLLNKSKKEYLWEDLYSRTKMVFDHILNRFYARLISLKIKRKEMAQCVLCGRICLIKYISDYNLCLKCTPKKLYKIMHNMLNIYV